MRKLTRKDIQGKYDLKIDLKDTVKYEYYFKKIGDKVYRFYKIEDGEWEVEQTLFKEEPLIFWNG